MYPRDFQKNKNKILRQFEAETDGRNITEQKKSFLDKMKDVFGA